MSNKDDFVMDEEDAVVELVDEDGKTERFVFVTAVEYENKKYALMSPEANEEEAVVFLIKEDGEDMTLESVVDEALLEKIYNVYLQENEEEE